MSNSTCAYCGGEFEPFGVRRYCGPQCANNFWRLYLVERHAATCLVCGRGVESADRAAWYRAVRTLQCEHCGGRILFEVENVGGLQSPTEVRIRKRTNDTPLRTRVA